MDTGKYVRYTPEQVEALERVYSECPKPSSLRRQQLIRECPILSNIEPKQIKVWFQNRRCVRRRRRGGASRKRKELGWLALAPLWMGQSTNGPRPTKLAVH